MNIIHKFETALKWLIWLLYMLFLLMLLPFERLCLRLASRNPKVAAKARMFFLKPVVLAILLDFSICHKGYGGDERWVRLFRMTIGREKVSSH